MQVADELVSPPLAAGETRTVQCMECPGNRLLTIRRLADDDPDYKTPGLKLEMIFGSGEDALRLATYKFEVANMPTGFLHNVRMDLPVALANSAEGLCVGGPDAKPSFLSCSVVDARDAAGFTCGERIAYLRNERGASDEEARRTVADEYPSICPACHAGSPPPPRRPACIEVDARPANGFTCGERISYLQQSGGNSREAARQQVADEFPGVCELCDAADEEPRGGRAPNGAWQASVLASLQRQCHSFSGDFEHVGSPVEVCTRSGISFTAAQQACGRFAGMEADAGAADGRPLHGACLLDYCAVGASGLVDSQEDVVTGSPSDSTRPITVTCPEGTSINATLYHHHPTLTFQSGAEYLRTLSGGTACIPHAPPSPPSLGNCRYVCEVDDDPPSAPPEPAAPPTPGRPPPPPYACSRADVWMEP